MNGCPYTWVRSLFTSKSNTGPQAQSLRVQVNRDNETRVDVSLPAHSARWLIELIPEDVMEKIRAEGIPIDSIQSELASRPELLSQEIFDLNEPSRQVRVWLE